MSKANTSNKRRLALPLPRRAAVLTLALALALTSAAGQAAPAGPGPYADSEAAATLPADRSLPLRPRQPDARRLRELAAQKEFQYERARPDSTFWQRLLGKLLELLQPLLGQGNGQVALTWRYVWYAGMVAALVFAVLKLLKVDITGLFGRSPRRALHYELATENIHAVDFSARIAEAEEAGNFRLATRLGYLETLKHLTDQGAIDWQPNKTNHAYLQELAAGPQRDGFREATRQFEYVWYGELPLSASLYRQVRAGQRAVAGRLTSTPTPV